MLCLTRKTDYALVALAALAKSGVDQHTPVSARRISESYALALPQLINVFKDLQRAGLVRSTRGARGGYVLADRPDRIALVSVIEAMEGPVTLTMCCADETDQEPCEPCTQIGQCPVTLGTRKLNKLIIDFLSRISLRDLMESNIHVPLKTLGSNNDRVRERTFAFSKGLNHDDD